MGCKSSLPPLLLGTTTVEAASVAFLVFAKRHACLTAFFAMAELERAPNSHYVSSQTAHSQTRLVVHVETPSAPMNRQVSAVNRAPKGVRTATRTSVQCVQKMMTIL